MKTALIVEDQTPLAQWLEQTLREAFDGIEVSRVDSLLAGRRWLRALGADSGPELALIDLGLPDGSGVELIRELSAAHPRCQCIVSTIYADDAHVFPALRAGARGYLLKDQPREKMVAALRGIAAGEPPLSATIARRLLRMFGDEPGRAASTEQPLSPRERETLVLIAKGCRLPEVALHLGVTRNTAAGFIKNVYRKLEVSSRAEATIEATRLGLVNPQL